MLVLFGSDLEIDEDLLSSQVISQLALESDQLFLKYILLISSKFFVLFCFHEECIAFSFGMSQQ